MKCLSRNFKGIVLLFITVSLMLVMLTPANARVLRDKELTVMTLNTYFGSELTDDLQAALTLFLASSEDDFEDNFKALAFQGGLLAQTIRDSNFPERANGLAKEIRQVKPDIIGLQEVSLLRINNESQFPLAAAFEPNVATVEEDQLQILIDALAAKGLFYVLVHQNNGLDTQIPFFDFEDGNALKDGRITLRNAILVRKLFLGEKVIILNSQKAEYSDQVNFLGFLENTRSWLSTDVKFRGKTIRFITTHLEAGKNFEETCVRRAQANELVTSNISANSPYDIILLGDFNTEMLSNDPDCSTSVTGVPALSTAYEIIADQFVDVASIFSGVVGLTCCHAVDLDGSAAFTEEQSVLDHIFYKGNFNFVNQHVFNDKLTDTKTVTDGKWLTDHAVISATAKID